MKRKIIPFLLLCLSVNFIFAAGIRLSNIESKFTPCHSVKAGKKLQQKIHFGFANTSGNTDTMYINGGYLASFTTDGLYGQPLKVAFDTSFYILKNNNIDENEEYVANLGFEQLIVNEWLGYASFHWLKNKFRNYDDRYSFGTGIGKELFKDTKQSLKAKFNVVYNIKNYTNNQKDEKYGSINQYVEYMNELNEISDFCLKVGASEKLDDVNDYHLMLVSSFNFNIADNLTLSIDEEIEYDKVPPIGFESLNTKTITRVGYSF